MKKRILAMLLAIVMLVGALPVNAFATEATDPTITPCETEGCEYASGHEGNCSNYVAPTECETEGCTLGYGHEGNCGTSSKEEEGVVIGYNKDQSMIGSIAGRIHGTIDNCVSYATVYGKDYVGGILGTRDNAMGGCVVTNSQFRGTVAATGTQVGGIAGGGYCNSTAPNGAKININNCSVSGSVTGADKVGGIIGSDSFVAQLWGGHSLKNNAFTGTVKATDGTYVGGIIGYYLSLNKYDDIAGNYYKSGCGADRGIGFVEYVDTSCETHETEMGGTYFNTGDGTDECPTVAGCRWKKEHNRTDDPLGADAAKLCYTDSTPITAIELKVSGDYKTELGAMRKSRSWNPLGTGLPPRW